MKKKIEKVRYYSLGERCLICYPKEVQSYRDWNGYPLCLEHYRQVRKIKDKDIINIITAYLDNKLNNIIEKPGK